MSNKVEQHLSVVIPIHNEESVLSELCARLHHVLNSLGAKFSIIFVDDGSTDDSLNVLKQLKSRFTGVKVIELARNYGQTAALAAGIDQADGEIIITMDGDLQHQPEEIPRFLSKLGQNYDIVNGWREQRADSFLFRRIPSKCANTLIRWISGVPLRDFGSTFKAYRRQTVKSLELFGELHRFIPALAYRSGARIAEIPINVQARPEGSSNYGLLRSFGVFEDLIFLEFYLNYMTKPIRAFGKLFFFFFAIGFGIALTLLVLWCFGRIVAVAEHGALLLLSVFMMIIGVQFLMAGVIAEILMRVYLNTSNRRIYSIRAVYGD